MRGGFVLGIALVGAAIASAALGPSPAHRATPVPQSAAGPSRATPGAVPAKETGPRTAHFRAGKPTTSRPHELFLKRASSVVFDVRKLKGPVVKRERPEHEQPYGPPEAGASAGSALPTQVSPSGIAAAAAPAPGTDSSFDGLDYANWGAGHPPDENGDVGPTYYIQTVNTSIGIYDKSTGTRVAAFTFDSFMSQGKFGNLCDTDNFGDPVVLYDSFENRWFITDFAFKLDNSGNVVDPPGAFQCFAVSKTGDPVNGGWNFYSIPAPGALNDYPKFGVWPDGIYMSANMFGYPATGSYEGYHVWALNKQQMYAGAPTVQVVDFAGDTSDFTVIPANARLEAGTPPAGSSEYFVSTEQFLNALSIYKFHVDWATPSASTFTGPQKQLAPNCWPNQSPANASTPANSADVLAIRAMAQAQYTNIGGAESLWVDHTVERGVSATNTTCNASKGGNATIRWYQANVTGGTVAANVVQGSTFDPDGANTYFRFMPSLAVDRLGDLAIGYTKSNSTTNPQIKYAGRLAGDPTNTLGQSEQTLINGTGAQSGTCGSSTCVRWGDYSGMALDPNGCEFWMTGEYYATNGLDDLTRIGAFHYPGCTPVGNGTLSGTVTDGTNPVAGADVSLGSRTTTTDASGNYSFTVPAGTYPSMTAAKDGFNPASASMIVVPASGIATQNFTLNPSKLDQTITVTTHAPASAVFGSQFTVAATAPGGAVTYSSGGGCSNSGATFTMTSGTTACQVKYDQAGSANYNAAPEVTESVTATKASQTITVTTHAPASAAFGSKFTVAATAGSGNAVTFSSAGGCSNSGATFTMTSGTTTCQVKYDQAGDANYNPAPEVTESVTATKAAQAITVTTHAPASAVFGSQFTVAATAPGGAVTYSSGGGCSSSGATFTMTSGTTACQVKYDQAGSADYNAAPEVTESVTATKASQTITVTTHAPASAVFNTQFTVAATGGGSGSPVTFSSAGGCSNSGATFTMTSGTTTCQAKYDQAGDANYNAAPEVTESVTATKASQTITVTTQAPATAVYATSFTVAATAPGGLVMFSNSGVCSNLLGSFTMTSGTGTCTVKYDQAGNANYSAAPEVTESVTATKASQSITVTTHAPASAVFNAQFTVAATGGGSGSPVTFSSAGGCSNTGATFTMTSGTTACQAKYDQAGDANYSAAPEVTESVSAAKADQAITVTTHAPANAGVGSSFDVAANAPGGPVAYTSSGSCTNSGATFTMASSTGTCAVMYDQAGNDDYNAAPELTETVIAGTVDQAISVSTHAPGSAAYGSQFVVAASAPGGPVTYSSAGSCSNSGTTFTMTGATGTCTVKYDQAGDASYNAAPEVTESVAAAKASQSITVTKHAPASAVFGSKFTVAATAGSGNAVTFSSAGGCSNSGATFTMTSGTTACQVKYDQAGNANYDAAPEVTESVAAAKASQSITVTKHAPSSAALGSRFTVAASGGGSGNAVTFSSAGACSNSGATFTMTGATGTCTVRYDQAGNGNYAAAPEVTETVTALAVRPCIVPKLKGKTFKAAKHALRTHSCSLGKVKRAFSHKAKKGRVISQRPKPGRHLKQDAKVRLVLSKGRRS